MHHQKDAPFVQRDGVEKRILHVSVPDNSMLDAQSVSTNDLLGGNAIKIAPTES